MWVASADGTDLFAVDDFELDAAWGADEQDFSLSFSRDAGGTPRVLAGGELVYMDGSEVGGVVDSVESDTASSKVTYTGRTWHGVLARKVVVPPSDASNVVVSGDANAVIADLLARCDLAGAFAASRSASGIDVGTYAVPRFSDLYSALCGALSTAGARLDAARCQGGPVTLSASPVATVGGTSETVDMEVRRAHRVTNHLVCAGSGEGTARTVVHLYADERGRVSRSQTLSGVDELAELYDYSTADEATLVEQGTKRLKSAQGAGSVALSVDGEARWHVGDVVSAMDPATGVSAEAVVTKVVCKVTGGVVSWSCEVGRPAEGGSARSTSSSTVSVLGVASGGTGKSDEFSGELSVGLRLSARCGIAVLSMDKQVTPAGGAWSSTALGTVPAGYRPQAPAKAPVARQTESTDDNWRVNPLLSVDADGRVSLLSWGLALPQTAAFYAGQVAWTY